MRFQSKRKGVQAEGDMTPMIDMTFQLIAFFMVLINFADAEQNEAIQLPASELAKPPDVPLESPITLQVRKNGRVIFTGKGDNLTLKQLESHLIVHKQFVELHGKEASQTPIIIRGDRRSKFGRIQEIMRLCQDLGFDKFVFKAKQEERT